MFIVKILVIFLFFLSWKSFSAIITNADSFNRSFNYPDLYFKEILESKKLKENYRKILNENFFPKQSNHFRVMTYNIHYWTDIWDDAPIITLHIEKILKLIKESNADVIGLQEVVWNNFIHEKVKSYLELNDKNIIFCKASDWPGEPFGNVLISKYPINHYSCVDLPFENFYDERRNAAHALLDTPIGNVRIVVSHLDHQANNEKTRILQIKKILHLLEKESDYKLLLMDANTIDLKSIDSKQLKQIMNIDKFRGVCSDYSELKIIRDFGFLESFDLIKLGAPYISCWAHRKVDFIFSDNKLGKLTRGVYILPNTVSDHFPIYQDIDIKRKD